ncbi:hypothetical protein JW865_02725 [Candidatus Bathyarchaeota archaeon]|nr:hypothetical protein [Candidatus Bathyarchaeota archaeon]
MKIKNMLVFMVLASLMLVPAFATGNSAPSGPHYNLNIIGVPKNKSFDEGSNMGHRIFVPLTGKCTIELVAGPSFQVLDYIGTDGKAKLQLIDPYEGNYYEGNTVAKYSIWIRALGKPGGKANITAGGWLEDEYGQIWYYYGDTVAVQRNKGQSVFTDKTVQLTTIWFDVDGDGNLEKIGLFDDLLEGYFWDYDNSGLKLLQMRFYMSSS